MAFIDLENLKVNILGNDILKGIDFELDKNICVGIVGESGSGKTMFVRSLMGLLPPGSIAEGEYRLEGIAHDLNAKEKEWRKIRGRILGMVMQDPFTALDPLKKCGRQILDGVPKERVSEFDVTASLSEVGLDEKVALQYPYELSGGMRQRVVIAAALATEPKLLIADEATTALDVITQREILDLLDKIREKRSMPLMLITHNIRLARERTDVILVMDDGQVVEAGPTAEVIDHPTHQSTKMLLEADRFLMAGNYTRQEQGKPLLKAIGLTKRFGKFTAVDGVNIEVMAGEIVGIVGQSGSGKTTLARCIVGLTPIDEGKLDYSGSVNPQIVFQDPYSSLNPSHTVRFILEEALSFSGRDKSELEDLLRLCEIPEELLDRRPARLSGGQRQRVAIARSLAPRPDLLVCDESVSALDLVVQNQILATLSRLRKERDLAILFITHDLSVVRMLASRIYVMNKAKIVEEGTTEDIFEHTKDKYTRDLIEASVFGISSSDSGAEMTASDSGAEMTATDSGAEMPSSDPDKNAARLERSPNQGSGKPILYKNGRIYTVEGDGWEKRPAEAMAVGPDGKIIFVGNEKDAIDLLKETAANNKSINTKTNLKSTDIKKEDISGNDDSDYDVVDLKGRSIMPGMIDTHVHMPGSALTELFGAYLYDCTNIEETLDVVRKFASENPDMDSYFGTGFFMSITDDPCELRRELLDDISPDKPIILDSSDGHNLWLNSAALEKMNINKDTKCPAGGFIYKDPETGEPTGLFADVGKLINMEQEFKCEECLEALKYYQEKMIEWGYTAVMQISPHLCAPETLATLVGNGGWKLRTNMSSLADVDEKAEIAIQQAEEYAEMFNRAEQLRAVSLSKESDTGSLDNNNSGLLRVSTVKFFIDGVVEGNTAWLKKPYTPESGAPDGFCSEPLWDMDKLIQTFADISKAGYQIHLHTIGDAATAESLKALKEAREIAGSSYGHRDVFTHLQLLGKEEIKQMKEMEVIASFQPFWHFKEPFWYDEVDLRILGKERAEAAYPVGSALRGGVRITFSGDYPVSPTNNPFWAIQNAVTRNLSDPDRYGVEAIDSPDDPKWLGNPDERIPLKDAIEAYTINGAYQLFRENETGSLSPGKYADFLVLSGDPFKTDPIHLYKIHPEQVYIGGKQVK